MIGLKIWRCGSVRSVLDLLIYDQTTCLVIFGTVSRGAELDVKWRNGHLRADTCIQSRVDIRVDVL